MKRLLLLGVLCAVGCVPQFQMRPSPTIQENLSLFESFYRGYSTDYEVTTIGHHYMTDEDHSDEAYGHILTDFAGYEIPIYVYKDRAGGLYWYKYSPYTGEEHRAGLTPEQIKHIWSFN